MKDPETRRSRYSFYETPLGGALCDLCSMQPENLGGLVAMTGIRAAEGNPDYMLIYGGIFVGYLIADIYERSQRQIQSLQ